MSDNAVSYLFLLLNMSTQEVSSPATDAVDQNHPLAMLQQRLEIIETTVKNIEALLQDQRTVKEWYSITDAAKLLNKAEFTVREWCRLGRVNAHKRPCGRGRSQEWIVSHTEIERIRNKGLLPTDL